MRISDWSSDVCSSDLWRVDSQSNSVVVSIGRRGQQAGIDFVALSGADAQPIRFQVEDEQPSLRSDLKGGLGYPRDPGDGHPSACSTGSHVSPGGTPGYVTARPCGDTRPEGRRGGKGCASPSIPPA